MPEQNPSPSALKQPITLPRDDGTPVDANDVPTMMDGMQKIHHAPQQWLGEFELLEEIGRGGMGVVYRARQKKLDRVVALKMILSGRLANAEDLLRFRTEAEAAARLQHPNIVAVYEFDEVDGNHYFTMEFIQGQSLAQLLAAGPLPSKTAARYVRQIARAMHYAHEQGILHRDMKPSNILIDAHDEVHITDFGLAKRMNTSPTADKRGRGEATRTGALLGTPSYMAPEQASGKTRELGAACDIYGIGAVLYELLTGRPPFKADSPLETILQVLHTDPVPPCLLNPHVDTDLETICLKCLQKDPRHRYLSAEELADDLQRYQEGNAISARSSNIIDRLTRTLERSHLDSAFHTWSTMLLIMAGVVFVEHMVVFIMLQTGMPRWLIQGTRCTQFVLLGAVFWYNRGARMLPTSAAERELWTIWIGYFLAYGSSLITAHTLSLGGVIQPGLYAPANHYEELLVYPFSSVLSGLAFFSMGSNYWGRCYAIGVGFFIIAMLMPLHPEWSPLEFGVLWTVALASLGQHLRRLAEQAKAEASQWGKSNPPSS
jgi:serine/threonine protein kinase